jgi:SET domain-containing protein
VWVFDPRIDKRIPYDSLNLLPEATREFLEIYGYVQIVEDQKVVTLTGDFDRHMNHSDTPNVLTTSNPDLNIAARVIEVGEELTCDYSAFSLEFPNKITKPDHWGYTG